MSKIANKTKETIVWDNGKKETSEQKANKDNVIPFPQRIQEVTHQRITVHPDAKPIKIVSSGFGKVRSQLNTIVRSCAA
jgi:hypothetical protein